MSAPADIYRVTPRQLRACLLDIAHAGLVANIIGSPGIGKSAITASVSEQLHLKMIDHRLSTSAPEDMTGLPHFTKNGEAVFAPFRELFPLEDQAIPDGKVGWMLFLDEMNSASKAVQAAAYKLVLDKMVGQRKLHPNTVIVCAGNLATDRAIVNKLGTAMQSRVITLELEVNYEEWLYDVAFKENYDPRIIAYLGQYESKLMNFKPDHTDHTFCSPRTWAFMNRLIKGNPVTPDKIAMYAGTISKDVAVEFQAFCALIKDMITFAQIMADPTNCPMPTSNSLKWATVSHMAEKVDALTFDKLGIYADRLDMSFRVLFYRSVLARQPALRSHPTFAKAMSTLAKYLAG